MPTFKRTPAKPNQPATPAPDARQQGLRAFQAGRFDTAIALWAPLATSDEAVRAALAEAHFRRALLEPNQHQLEDIRRASELAPGEPRYRYHLAMRLHSAGDLPGALEAYRAVLAAGGPHGAALLLTLAALEQNPKCDLAALPGATPQARTALAVVQALLLGKPLPGDSATLAQLWQALGFGASESEGLAQFWQGLAQIGAGSQPATIDNSHSLPGKQLLAIRSAYRGVAAAQQGDYATALKLWQALAANGERTAVLFDNLVAALYQQLNILLAAGDLAAAATLANETASLPPGSAALNELRIQVLDQAAHQAATSGEWAQASMYWETARQLIAASTGLGSPRPFWHNLALAYEAQEQWLAAAEAWRGMLRTRPRKKDTSADDGLSAEQWAWVRKRVIDCYKHAGRPDEAVTVFRQLIKAEPHELDLRVQLADALLANDQEQAAYNEIQRILKIDPQFTDALIRHAALLSARGYTRDAAQVLRELVARHPKRDDLRRQLARMLLEHAGDYIGRGADDAGIKLLEEGQGLDPENYKFPLNIARARFNQHRPDDARTLLERALELGGDKLEAYLNVFQSWLIEEDLAEAQALLARVARLNPPPEFYIQLGGMVIGETTPPPEGFNPFFMAAPKPAKAPSNTPWTQLGRDLLDQALAQRPNDARLLGAAAAAVMAARPDLALPYAERAVQLAPEEPQTVLLAGLVLGLNGRTREAKDRLRRAASLARKRGDHALADEADDMRRQVESPLFRMAFQMQSLVGNLEDLL